RTGAVHRTRGFHPMAVPGVGRRATGRRTRGAQRARGDSAVVRATEALRQGLDGWGGKRARGRAGPGQPRGIVGSRGSVRAAAMAGVVLAGLWLAGCAMGGGGGGGAQAKPSPEEVRSAVRQELQSPEMQAQIQQIITQQVQALAAQQVLLTPEGQKQLVEQLKTVAASPQGQAAMQTGVQSFLRSP